MARASQFFLRFGRASQSAVRLSGVAMAVLGICHRTMRHKRTGFSAYFRAQRSYPSHPKTLGEHLRKKRIDLSLSMTQLAKLLRGDVTDTAIEKWEKGTN